MTLKEDFGRSVPIDLSKDISVLSNKDESFDSSWNEFIKSLPRCSFMYNRSAINYYIGSAINKHIDYSFIVRNKKNILAIVPLIICYSEDEISFSYDKTYLTLPSPLFSSLLSPKNLSRIEKLVFNQIIKIAKENKVDRYFTEEHILSHAFESYYDNFISKFFKVRPKLDLCRIIDLSREKDELWEELRHSYKSLTNKGLSNFEFKLYDYSNISKDQLDLHILLHSKLNKNYQRSIKSYEDMHMMVLNKEAIFHIQLYKGEPLQTLYTLLGNNTSYGGSVSKNYEIECSIPSTHSLNWQMFLDLKKLGIKYYETRFTSYWDANIDSDKMNDSKKVNSIGEFKRGFSQNSYPCLRWNIDMKNY